MSIRISCWTADGRRFEEEIPGGPPVSVHRMVLASACKDPPGRRESPGPWPRTITFSPKRYCDATGCVVYEEQPADAETARAS